MGQRDMGGIASLTQKRIRLQYLGFAFGAFRYGHHLSLKDGSFLPNDRLHKT